MGRQTAKSPGLNGVGNPSKMYIAENVASDMHVHYDEMLEESIEVMRLDDLPLSRLDMVKIDVESMEMDLLLGAEASIQRFRPILYVEDAEAEDMEAMRQPTTV